jgi:hypothetical protein
MKNHSIGAARANRVATDLQTKGFEVFREDGLCSFDIVVHKNGYCARMEVKGFGKRVRASMGPTRKCHAERFDILATVQEDHTIVYQRSIFCAQPNPVVVELTSSNEQFHPYTTHRFSKRTNGRNSDSEI